MMYSPHEEKWKFTGCFRYLFKALSYNNVICNDDENFLDGYIITKPKNFILIIKMSKHRF